MTLIGISGDKGSGKTLLATLFAIDAKVPVYSNYRLNIPDYRRFSPYVISRVDFPSLTIVDEAYNDLQSRMPGQGINIYLSTIQFQSRKMDMDWILTFQLNRTIDINFREMYDLYIEAESVDDGFAYKVFKMIDGNDKLVARFLINWDLAKEIYPYYNTKERIHNQRFEFGALEYDFEELNKVIDDILLEMKKSGAVSSKKENIKDWLLRHSYPTKLSEYVHNRMVSVG
jgi:hypothetical protein